MKKSPKQASEREVNNSTKAEQHKPLWDRISRMDEYIYDSWIRPDRLVPF